jgi:hypothetical protein
MGQPPKEYVALKGFLRDAQTVLVWIEQVSIGRPMVPEKDKTARERRVFPTEARSPSVAPYNC